MIHDLTKGRIGRTLLAFSLPFLLSCFLQTLYGMVDLYFMGRYGAVKDITAVSVGSQVLHMLTVMVTGLSMGATVMVARLAGAKRTKEIAPVVGNTVDLFLGLSVALTLLLFLLAPQIVSLLATPGESQAGTILYLRVCFCGLPFITAYNLVSAILRGLGDSRSPMVYVAQAGVLNILLDYLFLGRWGMGPGGAALATVLSQGGSVFLALASLSRRGGGIPLGRSSFRPRGSLLKQLLQIGLPLACQDGFIQVAFMVITVIANLRGLQDAAAVGIVEKQICFLFLVPSAMLASVSAMAAQNMGVGCHRRARQTLGCALAISMGYGLLCILGMSLLSERAVALFTTDAQVIRLGGEYMRGYVWDCLLAGIHFCFSGFFCAYGRSGLSFLHNALSILLARIPLAYLASLHFPHTLYPMGLATSSGSALSALVCLALFLALPSLHRPETLPPEGTSHAPPGQ
ncbi:MAG: MATE family efflux transporter [Oligosphaeraceae bacterium]